MNSISTASVKRVVHVLWIACGLILCIAPLQAQTTYPFQDPNLPMEERVSNIVSLMTLPEKVGFLQHRPRAVARLGIPTVGWVEGLHGVAAGRPGNWGRRSAVRTTTFPQSIGLGETWDPAVLRLAGGVEGYEARYLVQSPKYRTGGLVVRAPNADLARDPRWGRTEKWRPRCKNSSQFHQDVMCLAITRGPEQLVLDFDSVHHHPAHALHLVPRIAHFDVKSLAPKNARHFEFLPLRWDIAGDSKPVPLLGK
ncbi:MAG: hypothetical protein ACLQVW_28650 [Limisphaerales bacterium]